VRRLAEAAESKGGMLAIKVPAEVSGKLVELAKRLANPHAATKMHCTLAFFPDLDALGSAGMEMVERIAAQVARKHLPLTANIVGAGVFNTLNGEEGGYPYVAVLNAAGLNLLQADIVRALVAEGIPVSQKYGYVPHVTLGYDPGGAAVPAPDELPRDSWDVDDIHAYWEWDKGHPIRMVEVAPKGGRIEADRRETERRGLSDGSERKKGREPADGVRQLWWMVTASLQNNEEARVSLRRVNEELERIAAPLAEASASDKDLLLDPEIEEEFGSALALAVAKLIEQGDIPKDSLDNPSKLASEIQKVLADLRSHRGIIAAAMRRLKRRGAGREIALVRRGLARI
jgi:2'-5' RNA ligase